MRRVLFYTLFFLFFSICSEPKGIVVASMGWDAAGKGKIVDYLGDRAKIVVRSQGASSAGHRVRIGSKIAHLHMIPVGIIRPDSVCYLTAGMALDIPHLLSEIEMLKKYGIKAEKRLWVSSLALVIMPYHKRMDCLLEKQRMSPAIGSSFKGMGPCYADRANRVAIRVADIMESDQLKKSLKLAVDNVNVYFKAYKEKLADFDALYAEYSDLAKKIKPYFKEDAEVEINKLLQQKGVLFEGALGTFLDNALGSYPYVSSTYTTAAGICAGAGVGPSKINHTLGVVRAYETFFGNGPFPTEIFGNNDDERKILEQFKTGSDYVGKPPIKKRYGHLDLVVVRQAIKYNGIDSLAISGLDILGGLKEIRLCIDYKIGKESYDYFPPTIIKARKIKPVYITMKGWKNIKACKDISKKGSDDKKDHTLKPISEARNISELPEEARAFIKKIEAICSVPVSLVSVGPEREQTILVSDHFSFLDF